MTAGSEAVKCVTAEFNDTHTQGSRAPDEKKFALTKLLMNILILEITIILNILFF